MNAKLKDQAVEVFRLPHHETRHGPAGWMSEAPRLLLDANRPVPRGK